MNPRYHGNASDEQNAAPSRPPARLSQSHSMTDPPIAIINCPNGHELQAARDDLGKTLACPICNAAFKPTAAEGPETAVVARPVRTGGLSLSPPTYTTWLIRLWLTAGMLQFAVGVTHVLASPDLDQPLSPDGGILSVDLALGQIQLFITLPAVLLQLFWIYRIHNDARRSMMYRDVSPGLALGLSFIPILQYPWTAWTLLNLSQKAIGSAFQPEAIRRARTCLVLGVLIAVNQCVTVLFLLIESMKNRHPDGTLPVLFDPADIPILYHPPIDMLILVSGLAAFLGAVVYVRTVRTVEAALYPATDAAPEREHNDEL